jgi:hypothetical protein
MESAEVTFYLGVVTRNASRVNTPFLLSIVCFLTSQTKAE